MIWSSVADFAAIVEAACGAHRSHHRNLGTSTVLEFGLRSEDREADSLGIALQSSDTGIDLGAAKCLPSARYAAE